VFLLVSFLMDGFAIAAQAMVGSAVGSGDYDDARGTFRVLVVWGVGGGLAVGLGLLAAEPVVVGLFTDDLAVVAAVSGAWWLATLGHGLNGLVFVLDGVAMGAADYRYLRTWTVTAAILGGVLAQVGVSLGAGLLWLWACVEIIMVVRGASLLLRLRGTRWLAAASRPPG
jgi:Na+-driven multidrug efflux pump